jgi:hypothetical protein
VRGTGEQMQRRPPNLALVTGSIMPARSRC